MKQYFEEGEMVKIIGHSYYKNKKGIVVHGGLGPILVEFLLPRNKTQRVYFTSELLEKI